MITSEVTATTTILHAYPGRADAFSSDTHSFLSGGREVLHGGGRVGLDRDVDGLEAGHVALALGVRCKVDVGANLHDALQSATSEFEIHVLYLWKDR